MKLLYVPALMVLMAAAVATNSEEKYTNEAKPTPETREWTTPGESGRNLNGKMFTLSTNGGGILFYRPNYYPASTPWLSTTRRYTTTYPWTTAPSIRSVSVCLRYLTDSVNTLFTLTPSSRNPLRLKRNGLGYQVNIDRYGYYDSVYLEPNIKFWTNLLPDIWTRVCLTVDGMKNVAQVFSGANMSIRKFLPIQFVWAGEPVIDISGFDGQVTDIQMWDYPLSNNEVFYYMRSNVYGPYPGSVLTWSDISYSPKGQTLLEDVYERQAKQPISSRRGRKGCRPKGQKKFYNMESKKNQL